MNGEAESSLAGALDGRRDEVTIATKIWAQTLEEGREQYRRQLDWFDRVDVEQIHNLVNWRQHLEWIEEERDAGRVGMVGVTHWNRDALPDLADALRSGRFEQVQLPYNPAERECEEELLPIAAEQGLAVIVMRPFADGGLLGNPPPQEALEPLRPFGIETWPQALLKWVLSDERVDVAIPATSKPGHVHENAAAGVPPWLGQEERDYITRLALG
jgi:diketogulonate reductase-like aldo/keto reductase